jgi:hypothetical protein
LHLADQHRLLCFSHLLGKRFASCQTGHLCCWVESSAIAVEIHPSIPRTRAGTYARVNKYSYPDQAAYQRSKHDPQNKMQRKMDNMAICKGKGIYPSMYIAKRIRCMRVCPSVCEKGLLDACAHEREAFSTGALNLCDCIR